MCKGVEIERKDEYDTLASILNDVKFPACDSLKESNTGKGLLHGTASADVQNVNSMNYNRIADDPWVAGGYRPWFDTPQGHV